MRGRPKIKERKKPVTLHAYFFPEDLQKVDKTRLAEIKRQHTESLKAEIWREINA